MANDALEHFVGNQYLIRHKYFKLFGEAFYIYDANGQLVMYSKMKAFKLKEDVRLYTDESRSQTLLLIKARNVIDFSAYYDVVDGISGETLGSVRRQGARSLLRDEWLVLDTNDQMIGMAVEDTVALAALRRITGVPQVIAPQGFRLMINDRQIADMSLRRNPVIQKMDVTFYDDAGRMIDPRLGLSLALMLMAIEFGK